jgi:hypothetical protein
MCGNKPHIDKAGLQKVYFGTSGQSIDNMFKSCSHGYARFLSTDNIIIELNVPCTGTTVSGQKLGDPKKKCDFPLMLAVKEWAETYVRNKRLVSPAVMQSIQRRIHIYPSVCPTIALGTTGCGPGWCDVWMAQAVIDVGSYVHEIGHTQGLNHASIPTSKTGDASSPMGWCCGGAKCHNAPHLLQLGWTKPMLNFVVLDMPLGRKITFTIPELALSNKNMVRIRPVWKTINANVYIYISYRAPVGYDVGILPEWTNAVHVHSYVEGDPASLPMAEAQLVAGSIWKNRAFGISVSVKVMNGTTATAILTNVS